MRKVKIKLFNVVDRTGLPEIKMDRLPVDGDPVEIESEMYFASEKTYQETGLPFQKPIPF